MTQPKFIPKPGQIDYTHVRYAPVINTIVTHGGKILLAKRSADLRLYPNFWNGISGFLDDDRSIEEKVYEELREELGIEQAQVKELTIARPLRQEAPDYGKTWLVNPVRAEVTATDFKLDWEATEVRWFTIDELKQLDLMPGFREVLAEFFPGIL